MPTYTYDGPTRRATRKGMCPTCGKPSTRTRAFSATVNPFNLRPDGVPKTWAEVDADVAARAEAWAPEPDEFEHDKCRAERLAPTPAGTVPVDPKRTEKAVQFRQVLVHVAGFAEHYRLPMTKVNVRPAWNQGAAWRIEVAFVPDGEIVMWARAFGLDTVAVEEGGHCTHIRIRHTHTTPELNWAVDAAITKPPVGDRLGGAPIEWKRDGKGKRTKFGTIGVDDLAAGLARIGIAVTTEEES